MRITSGRALAERAAHPHSRFIHAGDFNFSHVRFAKTPTVAMNP